MKKRLIGSSIAFGVFAAVYNGLFGLFFGFFFNVIVAIIEAAAKTDGTWTTIFMFGGAVTILLGVADIVACVLVKRKPMVAGIIFASCASAFLTYGVLIMARLFAPAFLGFLAVGLAFYAVAIGTSFGAYAQDRKAQLMQALAVAMGDEAPQEVDPTVPSDEQF